VISSKESKDYMEIRTVNNHLIVGYRTYSLFDLSKSLTSKGIYFKSSESLYGSIELILPNTGVIIEYATIEYYSNTIMRSIYNIDKPQIKKIE
jgi:hypothetical protein